MNFSIQMNIFKRFFDIFWLKAVKTWLFMVSSPNFQGPKSFFWILVSYQDIEIREHFLLNELSMSLFSKHGPFSKRLNFLLSHCEISKLLSHYCRSTWMFWLQVVLFFKQNSYRQRIKASKCASYILSNYGYES